MQTLKLSSLALVAANLVPLIGVWLFGWRVLDILMLYWIENVIIGVINVMRMAVVPGARKWFLMPFFSVHYGIFCFGHLMAIVGLFGESSGVTNAWQYFIAAGDDVPGGALWRSPLWIAIAGIAASHLISYFTNFLGAGEYRRASIETLMMRPYGRIVVLHVSIIIGAALIQWLGSPVSLLVVLVVAKIALDLRFHVAERNLFQAAAT